MKQGETVSLEFVSADASTAAAMTIKDANGATRTLAAWERLLIDTLSGAAVEGETPDLNLLVSVFHGADGTLAAGELIASFISPGGHFFDGGEEGYSVPIGQTPLVDASAAGAVHVTGSARIIKGQTEGLRPSWREALLGRG